MNKSLVRSPINMTGRKIRLLPQILPYFPPHDTFLDVFGGSGDVSVNNRQKTIINDSCKPLVDWLAVLYNEVPENILYNLDMYINAYGLNGKNEDAYYFMRSRYNDTKDNPYLFYLLHAHAWSNGIRFNSKGGWNLPFGKRKFNDTMRANLKGFVQVWQQMDIEFHAKDFMELDYTQADFCYFDPPYFKTVASYNSSWTLEKDNHLLSLLDSLDTRWAMSNVFENNGHKNQRLIDWSKKYRVVYINSDYSNASSNRKQNGETVEVIIMNY